MNYVERLGGVLARLARLARLTNTLDVASKIPLIHTYCHSSSTAHLYGTLQLRWDEKYQETRVTICIHGC